MAGVARPRTANVLVRIQSSGPPAHPSVAQWQEATGSNPAQCEFESRRSDHLEGDVDNGSRRDCLSRSAGSTPVVPAKMGSSLNGGIAVSVAGSTLGVPEAHDLSCDGVRIPCPRPTPRRSEWRGACPTSRIYEVRFLDAAPFNGGRRQTARREAVNLVLAGSTPVAHPNGT
jgi:hypothetical protein